VAGEQAAAAARPQIESITLASPAVAAGAASDPAIAAAPAPSTDPHQALREALEHLEAAVALLKAALDSG